MKFSPRSTETQFDDGKSFIIVSFGSGDMFPIHRLTIPFSLIVRLTLFTCRLTIAHSLIGEH